MKHIEKVLEEEQKRIHDIKRDHQLTTFGLILEMGGSTLIGLGTESFLVGAGVALALLSLTGMMAIYRDQIVRDLK